MHEGSVLLVQRGNYAAAYRRFEAGEPEAYRDQRRSVETVAGWSARFDVTTLSVCRNPGDAHDVALRPSLHSIGVPLPDFDAARVAQLFDRLRPDLLICRTPDRNVLREARRRGIPTLPCFADIFQPRGVKARLRQWRLGRILGGGVFPCVANHSLNASRSLASGLGIAPDRIVPWDWTRVPVAETPKAGCADARAPRAFLAGQLIPKKGVGDCLQAVAQLRAEGLAMTMSFAGPGDLDHWRAEADRLGVADAVEFLGQISNARVRAEMRQHDIVIVASQHSYPEGLPNTIYEGLASRSAVLLSDHPSFVGRLQDGRDCLFFEAANPAALAGRVRQLLAAPALYGALSDQAPAALEGLYVGLEWADLTALFLEDPENATGWVARHALSGLDRP